MTRTPALSTDRVPAAMIALAFVEFFIVTSIAIVAPRGAPVALAIAGLIAVAVLLRERVPVREWLAGGRAWLLPLLAFGLFAGVSALWSAAPAQSVGSGLLFVAVLVLVGVTLASAPATPAPVAKACLWGFAAAYGSGLGLAVVEVVTDQGLTRWLMEVFPALQQDVGKHTFVRDGEVLALSEATANRRTAVLTLFAPAAALFILTRSPRRVRLPVMTALVACLGVAVWGSEHQSSQLAFFTAALAATATLIAPKVAFRVVAVSWIAAVVAVVPVALALERLGAHSADWLPESARQRVIIWGTTAAETAKSPWLGIGANATAFAPGYRDTKPTTLRATTSVHAHNTFLQVWYELGATGAALLLVGGLAVLAQTAAPKLRSTRLILLAQFALTATMISASYGSWQLWFISAIAYSAIMSALIVFASSREARMP